MKVEVAVLGRVCVPNSPYGLHGPNREPVWPSGKALAW